MIDGEGGHGESVLFEDHLAGVGTFDDGERVRDATVAGRRHGRFAVVRDPVAFVQTIGLVETGDYGFDALRPVDGKRIAWLPPPHRWMNTSPRPAM